MAKAKEEINKSAAIKEILEAIGYDKKGAEIKEELLKRHPSLEDWAGTGAFSNYISVAKKRQKEGGKVAVRVPSMASTLEHAKVGAAAVKTGISEMLEVLKQMVNQHGKEEVKKIVDVL